MTNGLNLRLLDDGRFLLTQHGGVITYLTRDEAIALCNENKAPITSLHSVTDTEQNATPDDET